MIVDRATVAAAVGGDAEALRRALAACGPGLRAHFANRIARTYQAVLSIDDVLQVTYIEAFLQIQDFKTAGADSFFHWLRQIAENNLRDAIRELEADKRPDRRRQISINDGSDSYTILLDSIAGTGTTPTRHATREEAKQILSTAIDDLPPLYAKAIQLFDLEERDVDEVCNAFDPPKSRGAVHMLRLRARDCLRTLLGDPGRFMSSGS